MTGIFVMHSTFDFFIGMETGHSSGNAQARGKSRQEFSGGSIHTHAGDLIFRPPPLRQTTQTEPTMVIAFSPTPRALVAVSMSCSMSAFTAKVHSYCQQLERSSHASAIA